MRWAVWKRYRTDSDHDHCSFCNAEISDGPIDDHTEFNAAWVTADDSYHWVCELCFVDSVTPSPGRSSGSTDLAHLFRSAISAEHAHRIASAERRSRFAGERSGRHERSHVDPAFGAALPMRGPSGSR